MATRYDVRAIQRRLNALGFKGADRKPLVEDGIFGPNTAHAVVAFKRSVGLRARPKVGPITWAALMEKPGKSDLPWIAELVRLAGLHEERDRTTLERVWAKTVGKLNPDATAWCGQLQAHIMRAAFPAIILPEKFLSARAWVNFGEACDPQLGATLVFYRGKRSGWQGHVGSYLGETKTHFKVGGGNQSDAVTLDAWIVKDRLLDSRWPTGYPQPKKRIVLGSRGTVSVNEE